MTADSLSNKGGVWQWIVWIIILAALLALAAFFTGSRFGAIVEALTPPQLPQLVEVREQRWLAQNWEQDERNRFHHISQGTRTIPIPYNWFINLPRPASGLLGVPFAEDARLRDDDYLLRFGFIKGKPSAYNPDVLPVGFARSPAQRLPGFGERVDAIGFTCAACHTGQLVHDKTQYVIEGGPAMTDLGQLTKALAASMGQLALSSKLPFFDARFDRFARDVLGSQYADATKLALAGQLQAVVKAGAESADIIAVQEGFTRLDALNRIGNQVFEEDLQRKQNYSPINAPVNFPHIWTSSWFDWVQYDGSIMQPMVRNAGEALGVNAYLDVSSPIDGGRFASSIPMRNLDWIEKQLKGSAFGPDARYDGLAAPKWPKVFGPIDSGLAQQGGVLYREHCQACHLPPLNSAEIWQPEYYGPIVWTDIRGQQGQTTEKVLHVKMIPHSQIGTDPAQGNVLVQRTVDTAGRSDVAPGEVTPGMGLNSILCAPAPAGANGGGGQLVSVPFSDGSNVLFALALGATVQQTISAWFRDNYLSPAQQVEFWGERPNCLQAGAGYRARPLNGVWATAPFLHNGSVPSLMALLGPPEARPALVQLGDTRFDTLNVGITQQPDLAMEKGQNYADNGLFILDTSLPGNSNRGHEFSARYDPAKHWSEQPRGVIGPALDVAQRKAIIEFLKTL